MTSGSRDPAQDRELRCISCLFRMFTSRAPAMVRADHRCPACGDHMELAPEARALPEFVYPAVVELRRRTMS